MHTHNFVETYRGLVGYGADRETDENTLIYYLQKFSDDKFMALITKRLSDEEMLELFNMINRLLKNHLTESEYHKQFLKDGHGE
jgi:hypothetical protein